MLMVNRFEKFFLLVLTCILCTACGGGSSKSITEQAVDASTQQTFPLNEISYLYNHNTNSMFSLSDTTAWLVTGAFGGNGNAGRGFYSVSIFQGSENLPEPAYGIKSDYYMVAESTASTFYVKPLYLKPIVIGEGSFYNEDVGSVFSLDDNSSWLVTGIFGGSSIASRGSATALIYEVSNEVPDATKGVASGYIMNLSGSGGSGASFFVERLQ